MSRIASQMKRIQYTTSDSSASSLTIDEVIFNALDKKLGNANKWCKEKAREVRINLENEALEMKSRGELKDMDVSEYVKGKVSNGVRSAAYEEVINPAYLK